MSSSLPHKFQNIDSIKTLSVHSLNNKLLSGCRDAQKTLPRMYLSKVAYVVDCLCPQHHTIRPFCVVFNSRGHIYPFTPSHQYAYSPYCFHTFRQVLTRRICLTNKSYFSLWSFPSSYDLNPLSPKSDWQLISPHKINLNKTLRSWE